MNRACTLGINYNWLEVSRGHIHGPAGRKLTIRLDYTADN